MAEKKKKSIKPIINSLVLINLHISVDSCRRTLKNMSKKIADDNKADAKMILTSIKLIPPEKTTKFTQALSRCREFYKEKTLPWEDKSWRCVPVTECQGFQDDLETLIGEAKDAFEEIFVKGYQGLKDAAEKSRGDISVKFPTLEELKESFKISYNMGAVASFDDIRIVGIDTAMRKKIQAETEARYNEQLTKGLDELTGGLNKALENISDRVGDEDQKGKKYTRFLENLNEMTDTVKALNVTGNKVLSETCDKIKQDISCWSPEAIKTSEQVREHIKDAAGSAQDSLLNVTLSDDD